MSRAPRTERHLSLAWADQLAGAIDAELRHEAASLHDPGTESLLGQVFAVPTRHPTGHPTSHPATPQEQPMPKGLAHLPAALTQPGDLPPPIPFPARPPNARTTEPSESTRRRWARMTETEAAARQAAHADGVREGWRGGWRWGLWQGMAIGVLLASIGWALWLTATAPQAAPPSASPNESTPLTRRG